MRILIVANGIVRAGVSRVLSLVTKEWQKKHDVQIVTFKHSEPEYEVGGRFIKKGIFFRGCTLSQILHLYWILKTHKFDRIYGFSEDANYPLIVAAKWAGVADKVVLTVHNPMQKFSPKVVRRIKKHYLSAGKIIAVSSGVKRGLITLGVPDQKIEFVPNPIDLKMVDLQAEEVSVRLPANKINIVSVGRLHPHKGFDMLIQAFSNLNDSNIHLSIVGEGEERRVLEDLIENHDLVDKVTLIGQHPNPFSILQQSDIFVLSSRLEGWPLVLMEAMAVGLPVVAFKCPNGPDEIIEHGTNGLLVEANDIEGLSNAMALLVNREDLREVLGSNARNSITKYSVDRIAKQWLNV